MFNMKDAAVRSGFLEAGAITKEHARTFYFASRFLPIEKRRAAYTVYAICRISDEAVDSYGAKLREEALAGLKNSIHASYGTAELNSNLLSAFRYTVKEYAIPKDYFDELIKGMYMDIHKNRYADFDELYGYCYRVAGIVGLIMLKILDSPGRLTEETEKYAIDLGIAMQLTNILRDIKEDFARGRIYLAQREMLKYNVSEDDIRHKDLNPAFKSLLGSEITRARKYYETASPGIRLLRGRKERLVVLSMKEMYAAILKKIEKNGFDVFSQRARINYAGKIFIFLKLLFSGKYL